MQALDEDKLHAYDYQGKHNGYRDMEGKKCVECGETENVSLYGYDEQELYMCPCCGERYEEGLRDFDEYTSNLDYDQF